jgi:DNA repair protein RadC
MGEHDGHRHRLIDKMDSGKLCDHEYLEVLLFSAIPRRNTNELAHRLLAEFGSITGVLSATVNQLKKVNGVGESVAGFLCSVGYFCRNYYCAETHEYPETFDDKSFRDFVKEKYSLMKREVLDFYLLDDKQKIVLCKRFSVDEMERVVIDPEVFSTMLLDYKPSGMVAVHNHPNGCCAPSDTDNMTTKKLELICSFHNVMLCDHYIYASDGIFSYYKSGLMQAISQEFAIGSVTKTKEKG